VGIVKQGAMVTNEKFSEILHLAHHDPDFPI
jgi:hypothetical protein